MSHLCDSGSCTDHSRCNAIAVIATDRDAIVRDSAAGNATGLNASAARALAVAGTGNSAVAASPDDSVRRVAVVLTASYAGASCCCHDCYRACHRAAHPSFDRDRVPTAGDVAAPLAAVAAVGAAVPNAADVPDCRAVVPVVAVRAQPGFPAFAPHHGLVFPGH